MVSEDSTSRVMVFPVSVFTTAEDLVQAVFYPRVGRPTNLHATAKTKNKMEGGLFLNVIVGESATIFKLLSGKDKTLLVGRNAFLVLNLGLYIIDGIAGLHLKGDGLAGYWSVY